MPAMRIYLPGYLSRKRKTYQPRVAGQILTDAACIYLLRDRYPSSSKLALSANAQTGLTFRRAYSSAGVKNFLRGPKILPPLFPSGPKVFGTRWLEIKVT
ncbi:predicted protein [Aspergillus terreus NIH2624]|uniref:Uncharacterized protein n=1 Tax=Aspergillus terreus (strain NIH 2624 / FGSC A1156) TaxID=341663 RepID=Q0CCK1_ASPTN|nr:uncharacterized protein ATEG_08583 [Aspergillus terreus NIH2624]EAU30715.1 predicted protein [Aspergillus terreus NIH2624]